MAFVFPTTRWQTCSTSILDQVFEEIAGQVSDRVIDAGAVQFIV